MSEPYTQETIDGYVRKIFHVDDVTLGTTKEKYLIRYRGKIYNEDTAAAYDQLDAALKPYNLAPLFRLENGRHVILIVPRLAQPKASNPRINLLLFILTLLSVLASGALYGLQEPLPANWLEAVWVVVKSGLPFAVTMIVVLGTHEFGHYLAGRYHGVHVTLPYFIPMPLSPFGTMGAFINMKEPPKNRRHLLDIGLAGPLAGVIVAIPALIIGLHQSALNPLPAGPQAGGFSLEGNSILYLGLKYLVYGKLLPTPPDFGGLPPAVFWLRYFFTGQPVPYGGLDVMIGPVAFAAWAGLLVTGLNLLPAGQLDGGHLLYVLFGRTTARKIFPFVLVGLGVLGFFWSGWWLWALLLFFFFGRNFAEPLDQITSLDTRRKIMGAVGLVVFFLTFTPVPLLLIP
ncbi:MAG: site-2 protease family protein [Anaerolineaceae bacterium]|nr:site-2 protease family protein [Anaerolineaceae bacterium]